MVEQRTLRHGDFFIIANADYDHHMGSENPLDNYGIKLYHHNTRLTGYDGRWPDHYSEDNPGHVLLGYFSHGGSMWFRSGLKGYPYNCPWDSVDPAGYMEFPAGYEDDDLRSSIIEEYNAWCNGEVYVMSFAIYEYNEVCGEDAVAYERSTLEPVAEECYGGVYLLGDTAIDIEMDNLIREAIAEVSECANQS